MIIAPLLLLAATMGVITVDDDGPADFTDLPAALAAALPGDTLSIAPGHYTAGTITTDLRLVGSELEPPSITGSFVISGAPAFTLSGLELTDLSIANVPGRGRLDNCWVRPAFQGDLFKGIQVKNCPDILMTSGFIFGGDAPLLATAPGLSVIDSSVTLVDMLVLGPNGQMDAIGTQGENGRPGIESDGVSSLMIIGSTIRGGIAGSTTFGQLEGGLAIVEKTGSLTVLMRGSFQDLIQSGVGKALVPPPQAVQGTLTWSGGAIVPLPPVPEVTPAEPYLEFEAKGAFGGDMLIRAYGALGDACVVYFSSSPAYLPIPGVDGGPLLLDPAGFLISVAFLLRGQDIATTVVFGPPPGLFPLGTAMDAQALVFASTGPFLTNQTQLIIVQ